ncbi:MAG: DUF1015 domain-containing protein, partial [Bryobacteraceae bacterium]
MANVAPFRAYRYSSENLSDLVTQPYDKITPAMRLKYLQKSPYNLVRVILPDTYPAASTTLSEWISSGVLKKDPLPAFFAYYQTFKAPDTGETSVRKGFIGLGAVEDYSTKVVHRHEQTLSGPKKDRLEVLRHTQAHFGQLFMLYPDPQAEVEQVLDQSALAAPTASVEDEYGAEHRMWRITDPARIALIQERMAGKKLLIADGHHRYETALAFRDENPDLPGARYVMMTFVNLHSPGLKILATHRLCSGLPGFELSSFLERAAGRFPVRELGSLQDFRAGIGVASGNRLFALETPPGSLDVRVLHSTVLGELLGIGEEAVRDEKHLRYTRGVEAA